MKRIFHRLEYNDSSAIIGEQRTGKTSLLHYLIDPIKIQGELKPNSHRYLFVYVDMEENSNIDFWRNILEKIKLMTKTGEAQSAVASALNEPSLSTQQLEELFSKIRKEEKKKIVLLLDEIDYVAGNTQFWVDYYKRLRTLAANRSLSIVASSKVELSELNSSPEIAHFFNLFYSSTLGTFAEEEAEHLIGNALTGSDVRFDRVDREFLYGLTSLHPFFLQMGCFCLFEFNSESNNKQAWHQHVRGELTYQMEKKLKDYLKDSSPKEVAVLKAIAAHTDYQKDYPTFLTPEDISKTVSVHRDVLKRLVERVLLIEKDQRFAIFSPIFAEWLIQHPDANTLVK